VLIDWVTARIPLDQISPEAREALMGWGDRMVRYCARTGEVRYERAAWDSVRSDSHQLAFRVASDLWVQGSPARVLGDGCTVFGSGPSAALDLLGCVARMVSFVTGVVGHELPDAAQWLVSRVDVTVNLALPGLAQVRQALSILRGTEGGRYRVSSVAGDTVYHGSKSKLRKGKAYAKGPHLRELMKRKDYSGRRYSDAELAAADRLLRMELTLGREWFARVGAWQSVTAERLLSEWESYFGRMLGGVGVMSESVADRVRMVHLKGDRIGEGRARAALACWHLIQSHGWEQAKALHSKSAWYRHVEVLHAAGLGDADISQGQVVSLRRVELHAARVDSWSELHTRNAA
jgi:II/X family phage/plasmid replication protein